jgi:hypothetical protein
MRADNRDRVLSNKRKWYQEHKEKADAQHKIWVTNNRDKERQYAKNRTPEQRIRWNLNHKDKVAEASRKWLANNKEKAREASRRWLLNNKEKVREFVKNWRKRNVEKVRESRRNRRAHERKAGGKITKQEWEAVLKKYGNRCLYPGCEDTDITMDHVKPLSLGGTHTADNTQPLCRHHNLSKGAKYIDYRPY